MTYTSTHTDIHIKVEVYINRQGRYTETGKYTTVLQHESSYADTPPEIHVERWIDLNHMAGRLGE